MGASSKSSRKLSGRKWERGPGDDGVEGVIRWNRCLPRLWVGEGQDLECSRWVLVSSRCRSGVLACNSRHFQRGPDSGEEISNSMKMTQARRQSKISMFKMADKMTTMIWPICSLMDLDRGIKEVAMICREIEENHLTLNGNLKSYVLSVAVDVSLCSF